MQCFLFLWWRFEDGTVSFLDIIALNHAFNALYRITGSVRTASRIRIRILLFYWETLKHFKASFIHDIFQVNSNRTSFVLPFFAFREHSQHPTTHFWLGMLHLHAAVESLPWQRATSGSDIHWRPVWESKHTGRNLKLQPHGFSWTDNWVFSGTFNKLNLFPFNSLAYICKGSGGELKKKSSFALRWTGWPVCTTFMCAQAASATLGPASPSSGSPISRWGETFRLKFNE